jgi:hypothetical protein
MTANIHPFFVGRLELSWHGPKRTASPTAIRPTRPPGRTFAYDAEGRMNPATRQSDGYGVQFGYDRYAGKQRIEERALSNNASIYLYFYGQQNLK